MSKKTTVAIIVILLVVAIFGVIGYYVLSSNLWTADGKVEDAHGDLIRTLINMEDPQKKEEAVNFFLESEKITQKEADEILGK